MPDGRTHPAFFCFAYVDAPFALLQAAADRYHSVILAKDPGMRPLMAAGLYAFLSALLCSPVLSRGINTFVPPGHIPANLPSAYTVTAEQVSESSGHYVDAPQARVMAPPPMRLTHAGKVWQFLRSVLPGGKGEVSDNGSLHDPISGSAIGKFGEAYATSGPMGTGIAPHGNTVD